MFDKMPPKNNTKNNAKNKARNTARKNAKASVIKAAGKNRSFRRAFQRNSRLTRRDPDLSKIHFAFNPVLDQSKSNSKINRSKSTTSSVIKINATKDSKRNEKETTKGFLFKSSEFSKRNSAPSILMNRSASLRSNPSALQTRIKESQSMNQFSQYLDDSQEEVVVSVQSFDELLHSARRMQDSMMSFMESLRTFQEGLAQQRINQEDPPNSDRLHREMERVQRVRDMAIAKNNIKRQDNLKVTSERFDSMLQNNLGRLTNSKFVIQKASTMPNITNLLHGRLMKTKLFEKLSTSIMMKDEYKEAGKNQCTALLPYKTVSIGKLQVDDHQP